MRPSPVANVLEMALRRPYWQAVEVLRHRRYRRCFRAWVGEMALQRRHLQATELLRHRRRRRCFSAWVRATAARARVGEGAVAPVPSATAQPRPRPGATHIYCRRPREPVVRSTFRTIAPVAGRDPIALIRSTLLNCEWLHVVDGLADRGLRGTR